MAYTEYYVTKGGSASDNNAGGPAGALGGSGAPIATSANCSTNAGGDTITDDSGGSDWAAQGAAVNDYVRFDPGGANDKLTKITAISGADLTVSPVVAGSQSTITVNVGGAFATIQGAADIVAATDNMDGPPRINIQYDASDWDENQIDFDTNAGAEANPITFEGYETTAGDLSSNRPYINPTSTTVASLNVTVANLIFRNIRINNNTAGDHAFYINASNVMVERCDIRTTQASGGANGIYQNSTNGMFLNNYIHDIQRGDGIYFNGQTNVAFGNYITDTSNDGIRSNRSCTVAFNIIDTVGNTCISNVAYNNPIIGNVVYGATSNGIETSTDTPQFIVNNIIYGNGAYGINNSTADEWMYCDYNALGDNTSGNFNNVHANYQGANNVSLTGDPFTNAASGNFSLDSTTGEGAACRAAGFPGTMIGGTNVGYVDIGALQHQDAGGSTGGGRIIG